MSKIQAMPINHGRIAREKALLSNVVSVAAAIEALEELLIERGVLKDGELMVKIESLVKTKKFRNDHMAGDDD